MKVGDLVRLSAYGKKRKRASWIDKDDVGLVVKVVKYPNAHTSVDYAVRWIKSDWGPNTNVWDHQRHNARKDLAYVKVRK